jgi:putative resolvase
MNINEYISRKEAIEILKIHENTLYNMYKREDIDTIKIGTKLFYNVNKYLRDRGIKLEKKNKINICYCRVSSAKQKEDLIRQVNYMKERYPDYELIKDIGSGLNFKRKGLLKLIDYILEGKINEIVIIHKDRLCRFGYDLIEYLLQKCSNGKIRILAKEEEKTPMEEIVKDILSIMNVYVAKVNGLRKYKDKMKEEIEKK